ncbi:MAG: hypothetical protein JWP47_830 [Polaromonas sp.]|jgi:hypothetical protein|nr:hypothetical protein [Polaromonas sp.]
MWYIAKSSAPAPVRAAALDHLVVAAASLAEGAQWCHDTLGVVPGPGGEHPLMGTHNRLLRIDSAGFAQAYLEIIAINSGAVSARTAGARRWFDLDNPALQTLLSKSGPRLIHFVAATTDAAAGVAALKQLGLDRGEVLQASRPTPQGELSWKITIRHDGQRLFYGALPTLIQWGGVHPTESLPASGVTLQSLQFCHPRPEELRNAYAAIGFAGVTVQAGTPDIIATLQTPRGDVRLSSRGA